MNNNNARHSHSNRCRNTPTSDTSHNTIPSQIVTATPQQLHHDDNNKHGQTPTNDPNTTDTNQDPDTHKKISEERELHFEF